MKTFFAVILSCAAALAQNDIRGFTVGEAQAQREREAKAHAVADAKRLRSYMEKMAAEPHIAGSPASKAVADYAAGLLRSWGLDVVIEEFEALLPYPKTRSLEMTEPTRYVAKLQEPRISEDPDSGDKNQVPTYNAYSGSGDVTGQVVYVNYGVPADYEQLKKLNIDVKGKIVLARYGQSWRGTKAKVAQENGAIGCLIYSDPRDDGFFQGDVYPRGAFRPSDGVQRGSVVDMPVFVGDPLSPGWASVKGARKLPLSEATTLMKIPVLPISYADAQPFLANLEGPLAPEAWRGSLPVTYHIGPGPATARLKVELDSETRPIYNVLATIPGSSLPDEWVIYGNHHDAWVNGAADPVSGAIAVLETARSLAELRKTGWQPKRTIKFALWDAEEFGLMGSTEWVEKHEAELHTKAVAYLNSDMNGGGANFGAGGSSALHVFMREIVRDVVKPEKLEFTMPPVGAGSDYVAFIHHSGIASVNAGFGGGSGGIYHSIYDSVHWYTKFSDRDFKSGQRLTRVMSSALLRLADAQVLPFEFRETAKAVRSYLADLSRSKELELSELNGELSKLEVSADAYEKVYAKALETPSLQTKLNRLLIESERSLLHESGLPGRPFYKNQLMAPGLYTGYSAKTLPGIREAAEANRWAEANSQAKNVAAALRALRGKLEAASALLAQ
ncbi:MAG TPA: M28 family peptidase [Bryobacteraceae bacterium]|nr:M28 family peptidase [Bryobacteraceae bacterium]